MAKVTSMFPKDMELHLKSGMVTLPAFQSVEISDSELDVKNSHLQEMIRGRLARIEEKKVEKKTDDIAPITPREAHPEEKGQSK